LCRVIRGDSASAEEDWPGGLVVDDQPPITEDELASAVATFEAGGDLTGREMRAVVCQARVEVKALIDEEQAEEIERVRLHAQTRTKQLLIKKVADMRKNNQRRTQMLAALDDDADFINEDDDSNAYADSALSNSPASFGSWAGSAEQRGPVASAAQNRGPSVRILPVLLPPHTHTHTHTHSTTTITSTSTYTHLT
jgi:hypothetical protein